MKLFLIRHGQTDWNIKGKIQGTCDIELNDTGIIQAEEMSNKVLENEYKFSKIYSSPQRRAFKTDNTSITEIDSDLLIQLQ